MNYPCVPTVPTNHLQSSFPADRLASRAASSCTSRCTTHDSGPVWFAIPFLLRTFTFALCRSPGAHAHIVKYHVIWTARPNRSDRTSQSDPRKATEPAWVGNRRARPICIPPLSISKGVSANVRNCREVRQANRAMCYLDIPNRREHGLQGRFSPMGGPAAVGE